MDEKDKEFGDRLKRLREIKELTQESAADAIGIGISSLRDHEAGRMPNRNTLRKYLDYYQCNKAWLLSGLGDPWEVPTESLPLYTGQPIQPGMTIDYYDFVPMAEARLSAGNGEVVMSEKFIQWYAFRKDWLRRIASAVSNIVLMMVRGDSMEGPGGGIPSGATVMVDRGRTDINSGQIYALGIADQVHLKKLQVMPDATIRIISYNPEYPPAVQPADQVRIIGQVIWYAVELVSPSFQ